MRKYAAHIEKLLDEYPVLKSAAGLQETVWINPGKSGCGKALELCPLKKEDMLDAQARLERFADYIRAVFPETEGSGGIIESPLREIPRMKELLESGGKINIPGRMLIKLDSHLPVSGSIKARGGIYEVLKHAEDIALEHGILRPGEGYEKLASPEAKRIFGEYSVAVGSTGNLGLSIGIMAAKLGFKASVHMSADARKWKKDKLRSCGVNVVEYMSDYSAAVAEGRRQAMNDPKCYFVDDENSRDLFLGYSTAALRLKKQLEDMNITVDDRHPLFIYLPCGVGGGPGGVAFGLKLVFGDAVHCFFAEPTHSCCMLIGMATCLHNEISCADLGLDNLTAADGLAVGRASGFVGRIMAPFMSGCYTVSDEKMFALLAAVKDSENIKLEPSALAGMWGTVLSSGGEIAEYINKLGCDKQDITQLVWATGGGMVPAEEYADYYEQGLKKPLFP